jgi:hypothetical protein
MFPKLTHLNLGETALNEDWQNTMPIALPCLPFREAMLENEDTIDGQGYYEGGMGQNGASIEF